MDEREQVARRWVCKSRGFHHSAEGSMYRKGCDTCGIRIDVPAELWDKEKAAGRLNLSAPEGGTTWKMR